VSLRDNEQNSEKERTAAAAGENGEEGGRGVEEGEGGDGNAAVGVVGEGRTERAACACSSGKNAALHPMRFSGGVARTKAFCQYACPAMFARGILP